MQNYLEKVIKINTNTHLCFLLRLVSEQAQAYSTTLWNGLVEQALGQGRYNLWKSKNKHDNHCALPRDFRFQYQYWAFGTFWTFWKPMWQECSCIASDHSPAVCFGSTRRDEELSCLSPPTALFFQLFTAPHCKPGTAWICPRQSGSAAGGQ